MSSYIALCLGLGGAGRHVVTLGSFITEWGVSFSNFFSPLTLGVKPSLALHVI